MPAVLQRMLEGTPPGWLRKAEVRVICGVFAKAFEMDAPHMRGLRPAEALASLREFTAEVSDVTFRQIREHLGVYEQYLLCRITHFTMF